jgi:K+/H+ antiporter YhaU regulatory subunit KhtT
MASELIRPDTTTFLDSMMRDSSVLRVDEVKIGSTTHYRGKPIEHCDVLASSGVVLVSMRRGIGERDFIFNPPPSTVINSGDTLIVIGNPEQLEYPSRKIIQITVSLTLLKRSFFLVERLLYADVYSITVYYKSCRK